MSLTGSASSAWFCRGAATEVADAPLSLHPYLADATAGEDTSMQWRTAASPSARPPPECARIRSPLSAGLSPLRLEKHSVLQGTVVAVTMSIGERLQARTRV